MVRNVMELTQPRKASRLSALDALELLWRDRVARMDQILADPLSDRVVASSATPSQLNGAPC